MPRRRDDTTDTPPSANGAQEDRQDAQPEGEKRRQHTTLVMDQNTLDELVDDTRADRADRPDAPRRSAAESADDTDSSDSADAAANADSSDDLLRPNEGFVSGETNRRVVLEEFSAEGSSISEALSSLTDDFPAIRSGSDSLPSAATAFEQERDKRGAPARGVGVHARARSFPLQSSEGSGEIARALSEIDDSADDDATVLGDLTQVPVLQVALQDVKLHELDHHAGFILSRIDGELTYQDVITVSGMPQDEALRTLVQLLELGLIAPR